MDLAPVQRDPQMTSGVAVPPWVIDLASFRRWTLSDGFPESGRIEFLGGKVWVDTSPEELIYHNQPKGEVMAHLGGIVHREDLGRYVANGMRLVNVAADISYEPDGSFASWETFQSKKLKIVSDGWELEGTPDMVLEIADSRTAEVDTEARPHLYALAAIQEYWLVNARPEPPRLSILQLNSGRYEEDKSADGWSRSAVFGREFRLVRGINPIDMPDFTLEAR